MLFKNKKDLESQLNRGFTVIVTEVASGMKGCSDVQDAVAEDGRVYLSKKGDNYYIESIEDIDILCVDSFAYIDMIVTSWSCL